MRLRFQHTGRHEWIVEFEGDNGEAVHHYPIGSGRSPATALADLFECVAENEREDC